MNLGNKKSEAKWGKKITLSLLPHMLLTLKDVQHLFLKKSNKQETLVSFPLILPILNALT